MSVSPQQHGSHTGFLNEIRSGFGIPSVVSGAVDKMMGVTRYTNPNAGKPQVPPEVKGVSANKPFTPTYGNSAQTFGVHER